MNTNVSYGSSFVSGNPGIGDLNLMILVNAAGVNAIRGKNVPFIRSIVMKALTEESKINDTQDSWAGHDLDPESVDCNVIALRGWDYVFNVVFSHLMLVALGDPEHPDRDYAFETLIGKIIRAANNLDKRLPLPSAPEVPSMDMTPAPEIPVVEEPPVAETITETVPVAERPKRVRKPKVMKVLEPEAAQIEG